MQHFKIILSIVLICFIASCATPRIPARTTEPTVKVATENQTTTALSTQTQSTQTKQIKPLQPTQPHTIKPLQTSQIQTVKPLQPTQPQNTNQLQTTQTESIKQSQNKSRKNPLNVVIYTGTKQPASPFVILGQETVSKFNKVGLKRQEAYIRDALRDVAANLGGDAIINITHNDSSVSATVIAYQKSDDNTIPL